MRDKLQIEVPSQGWKQILTARKEMLDAYDRAREHARTQEVETHHGRVAEGAFRKWLGEFLPKRYGVTSGYVVSPGLSNDDKTPHFDVIIYDQLESPVLWMEDNPDHSPQGRSLAIPVEHVRAVLEVKSAFSTKTVRDALEHLRDLSPLLANVDEPTERYKLHLSPGFCCGCVFFELRRPDAKGEEALIALVDGVDIRGFFGGAILRGEGHALPITGKLSFVKSIKPIEVALNSGETHNHLLDSGLSVGKSKRYADDVFIGSTLMWSEHIFAGFAFDLIAMIQGTYEVGRLSSFYGFGATTPPIRLVPQAKESTPTKSMID